MLRYAAKPPKIQPVRSSLGALYYSKGAALLSDNDLFRRGRLAQIRERTLATVEPVPVFLSKGPRIIVAILNELTRHLYVVETRGVGMDSRLYAERDIGFSVRSSLCDAGENTRE